MLPGLAQLKYLAAFQANDMALVFEQTEDRKNET